MPTKITFHMNTTTPATLIFASAQGEPVEIKEEDTFLNVYIADTSRKLGGVQKANVLWHDNDQAAPQP